MHVSCSGSSVADTETWQHPVASHLDPSVLFPSSVPCSAHLVLGIFKQPYNLLPDLPHSCLLCIVGRGSERHVRDRGSTTRGSRASDAPSVCLSHFGQSLAPASPPPAVPAKPRQRLIVGSLISLYPLRLIRGPVLLVSGAARHSLAPLVAPPPLAFCPAPWKFPGLSFPSPERLLRAAAVSWGYSEGLSRIASLL